MKRYLHMLSLLLGLFVLTGCRKEPDEIQPLTKKNRTVINYMIADNNLYRNAVNDINEMESVWSANYDGNMVVYFYPVAKTASSSARYDERPRLLLIQADNDEHVINSQVLQYYDRTQDPCDPEVLKQVIHDIKELAPADNYGLIMWSHGSGWVPGAGPLKSGVAADGADGGLVSHSFGAGGYTHGGEMEIYDLAVALGQVNTVFDFIAFDACHMASIEVAYQLKDYADYFIASAAEIWEYGYPYHKMIPAMMETQADVARIGEEFFTYYDTFSDADYRDATIVVVNNTRLADLAAQVNRLTRRPMTGSLTAGQRYGRWGYYNTFYDLTDLVTTAWGGGDLTGYTEALDAAVVYKNATSPFFGINNVTYSGFSCYIPSASTPTALGIYKTRYSWSSASGMGDLVQ